MTDFEKDNFIKEQLKKDTLTSKNADDVFNNFLKGDYNMENNQKDEDFMSQNKENPSKKKGNKWVKFLSVAASIGIVFVGANVYATTQGYNNIFFMIKDLVKKEDTVITEKSEILSDRDITISYSNIEIAKGLNIQINRLIIKDNEAKLLVRVEENGTNEVSIKNYTIKDITDGKKKEVASQNSANRINSQNGGSYSEEIKLFEINDSTKKLEMSISDYNDNNIAILEIDLANKEIDLLSYNKNEIFEKLSETELKEVLGLYAYYHITDDIKNDEILKNNLENIQRSRELDIAMYLVSKNGDRTTKENVHKAIKEYLGKDITDTIIDETGSIYFENGEYKYIPRDGLTAPLVLDISDINYKNGIYTATIVYCEPGEDWSNIEELNQYKMSVAFKLNEDYTYTKYCLVDTDIMDRTFIVLEKDNNSTINNSSDNNANNNNNNNSNSNNNNNNNNNNQNEIPNINSFEKIYLYEDGLAVGKPKAPTGWNNYYSIALETNNWKYVNNYSGIGTGYITVFNFTDKVEKVILYHMNSSEYPTHIIVLSALGEVYYIDLNEFSSDLNNPNGESSVINKFERIDYITNIEEKVNDSTGELDIFADTGSDGAYLKKLLKSNDNDNAEKIYTSSFEVPWVEYWAPGIKFKYPDEFTLEEKGGYYRGNRQGEVSTEIYGSVWGRTRESSETISSGLKIFVYEPIITSNNVDNYVDVNNSIEKTYYTDYGSIKWYENYKEGKEMPYSIVYTNVENLNDGNIVIRKIEFNTDNIENYKITDMINWIIGTTRLTSY